MANQISQIKSKQYVIPQKTLSIYFKFFIIGFYAFIANISLNRASTCQSSVPSYAAITTEQNNFTGYATSTEAVVGGPLSNSLYYLYFLAGRTAVRKVNTSGSQIWLASFTFKPNLKKFIY